MENLLCLLGPRRRELQLYGVRGHEKSLEDSVLRIRRLILYSDNRRELGFIVQRSPVDYLELTE